jgi:hypothetical protein
VGCGLLLLLLLLLLLPRLYLLRLVDDVQG